MLQADLLLGWNLYLKTYFLKATRMGWRVSSAGGWGWSVLLREALVPELLSVGYQRDPVQVWSHCFI